MKKIVLTENQLDMVKKHIAESAVGNERYEREVEVSVYSSGVKIDGEDIDWVSAPNIKLNYLIEMDHRSWGIKDISLYSIEGPSEIEFTITPQVDDAEDVYLNIPIAWDTVVEKETQEGEGLITIGNKIGDIPPKLSVSALVSLPKTMVAKTVAT